jgi:hypothetical protein
LPCCATIVFVQNDTGFEFLLSFLYFWSDLVEIKILVDDFGEKNLNPSVNNNSASGVQWGCWELGGVKNEKVSVKSSRK